MQSDPCRGATCPSGWNNDDARSLRNASQCFPSHLFGLHPASAILINKARVLCLIECGDSYLLWNDIPSDCWRIEEPELLSEVVANLNT